MPVSGESPARPDGTPGLSKGRIFCAALLLGYLFLLCYKAFLSAGGSDSSGYLNAAKLFSRGKLTDAVEPLRRLGLSQEFARVFIPLGGLPFAAFLFLTNQIANGSPFRSGYGDMSSGFSLGFFPVRIRHYGYWLSALGTPFLVLGWLAVAGVRSLPRRDRLMLVVWPAVFLVFFFCWQPYETWWYTRFLLPAVPAMILAMFFVVERGFRPADRPGDPVRTPRGPKILGLALSVVVLATGIFWIRRFHLVDSARGEEIYPDTCRWAAAQVPPNSVIAAMQMTGAMRYYTGSTFARIDWIEPAAFPALRSRIEAAGYHWYALVGPAEKELLQKNLPGVWKEIARLRDQTLLRLDDTAPGDLPRSSPPAGLDSEPPVM